MSTESPSEQQDDNLRRIDAVTDTDLAHLGLEDLLNELLIRVRDLLGADTAAVLLRSGDHLVATAAAGFEEEVRQGVRIPIGRGFAGRIAAERQPVVLERVDHATVLNRLLWEKGIQSLLGVPLLAGGELLGVMHVGTLARRTFSEQDIHLMQLAGDRIALAAQGRISSIERSAAAALQRSLLPARPPMVPDLDFATRYVPGSGNAVAGDWYDVFALPGDRWGIVIGDVAGHGVNAATEMGRLRSVLRAYAVEYDQPDTVLEKLSEHVSRFEPEAMATVAYGILEPDQSHLRLSIAGHPPPVLAVPGEESVLLDPPVDPPIGVHGGRGRRATWVDLPPEALLFFYTDGLVERRNVSLEVTLEQLRATVTAGTAESVCAWVMARMVGMSSPEDDIAVIAVHCKGASQGQ